jgi:hypothetical protein
MCRGDVVKDVYIWIVINYYRLIAPTDANFMSFERQ